MATREGTPEGREIPPGARENNPFILVPHAQTDLQGYDISGGSARELVPVDSTLRDFLTQTLQETRDALSQSMRAYPTLLGGMVFNLHEKGIAKSHRPLLLTERAGIQPAGQARLDEMLVGSSAAGMDTLADIIRTGNTKQLRANLSSIVRITPWTRARRNPEGTLALRERGRGILRLFRYHRNEETQAAHESFQNLLRRLNIRYLSPENMRIGRLYTLMNMDDMSEEALDTILEHPAVRSLSPDPLLAHAVTTGTTAMNAPGAAQQALGLPYANIPTVAVFDTGTANSNPALAPWVASRDIYVVPPDTDHGHGTAVASLVAGAAHLNPGFANHPCVIHDVCGLESGPAGGRFSDLILRLTEAVSKRPDIKVWNLSLGSSVPGDEHSFGEMAQALDELTDRYGVLFVVAAGNYVNLPRRTWPPNPSMTQDRLSTPGDSVRALTVGSVAHDAMVDTLAMTGEPTPYSRRGPGPVFTPKPDIVHHGGNVHAPWASGTTSANVLTPTGSVAQGFGTSFAAPLASALAAHVWHSLDGHPALPPTPSLVKALMIHAAQLSSPDYQPWERRYYGAGLPQDALSVLYDRDDSFTLAFEAHLLPGAMRWRKAPYPIPSALRHNGKLRGEVIITAAYAPPLDSDYGAEYVRANLELGFGVLEADGHFHGRVPQMGEVGTTGYESEQVTHGGKWAPVKVHRRRFPQGIAGDQWALQAGLTLRALEQPLDSPLRAYIIVTLRALDGNPNVHSSGVQELNANNWIRHSLPVRIPITV